ncbi:metallophosphoesterase family protein [Delftia sp. HK171]|uniref:metallophosphoesterase family protein n=1 Tax=Delftia sp. HK171 TaxID=1920191 RepID=UPI0018DD95D8|nr:metallophosphoesterase [Delftia sp. HK171]
MKILSDVDNNHYVNWLHLSDFHTGKDDFATGKMFDYIIRHVEERLEGGVIPDFLFLTGDLVQSGKQFQYEDFWLKFVDPLQQRIGNGIADRTFAVPGNHDLQREVLNFFDPKLITDAQSRFFDADGQGAKTRTDQLFPRFSPYVNNDMSAGRGHWFSEDGAFAVTHTIRGRNVGVAGINTAWLCKDENDKERLSPGKPLVERALERIADAEIRLVLGHHPMDWIVQHEQKPLKSLLGKFHAIYLHGHLHESWAQADNSSGGFLAIQAGAAFQAREGERWKNGLLWGRADLGSAKVLLQPWTWNSNLQQWNIASDALYRNRLDETGHWWSFDLPVPMPAQKKVDYTSPIKEIHPPRGWSIVNASVDLQKYRKPLLQEDAVKYFEGGAPDWAIVSSTSIGSREIVDTIVLQTDQFRQAEKPFISLLLGSGCEGKSTVLLQAAQQIASGTDWRILHRRNEGVITEAEEIIACLSTSYKWLLLVDDAANAAALVSRLLEKLPAIMFGKVFVLMASRESDWRMFGAQNQIWPSAYHFCENRVEGLTSLDADLIVESWGAFGEAGLGRLAEVDKSKRASKLEEYAKKEATMAEGALFGALLTARMGSDLRLHATHLLDRLSQHRISEKNTLCDALLLIAVMHAEGLDFLSRPVLASALGINRDNLYRDVLVPLGREAAATTRSGQVYTRHRRIAEALILTAADQQAIDTQSLLIKLVSGAMQLGRDLPNSRAWRFSVSETILPKNPHLAIEVAKTVLVHEDNQYVRSHLGSLYRNADRADEGALVFREKSEFVHLSRAFALEWGITEGLLGNQSASVILEGYSLSDQCERGWPTREDAQRRLSNLGYAFGELFLLYGNVKFSNAQMSVALLGLALPSLDGRARSYFNAHKNSAESTGASMMRLDDAIESLKIGIDLAAESGINPEVVPVLPDYRDITFFGLRKVVGI